ncbi:MAG TPA: hypothetical protein PLV80_13760, partial [Prolixibacteraceae bacterium]|nr:hypothetical protein [Prolixibacteraceae bacterium]HQJ86868.1 hypothetical protein [Prolixibacteraceae bacterium]
PSRVVVRRATTFSYTETPSGMPPVAPVIAVGVNIRHGGMVTFSVEIRFGDNALSADELNHRTC